MVAATAISSIEAAVTITDGTGAAVTTNGAIIAGIITGKLSLHSPSSPHCPAIGELQRRERVAPAQGAAGSAVG
jgi:hypothetical protein